MPRPRRHLEAVDRPDAAPLTALPTAAPAEPREDARVRAVRRVLAGEPALLVARDAGIAAPVLHRWVRAFVDAGTAAVTNVPDERVAAQRDRFLAAFAHELRTPLTVAVGWLRVLDEDELDPATVTGVARVRDALDRLYGRLVDVELLAAASLGRLALQRETVAVGSLLEGLPTLARVTGVADDLPVCVDVALCRRVVRELADTAALPPTPDSVHVEAVPAGDWVEVRVVREADPIDPAVLQALFEPFEVNDDATGVTFGLYLARALVVAHGGTLGVEQDEAHAVLWARLPHAATDDRPPGRRDLEVSPT